MNVKRYRRATVQEALRAVAADLGSDALVVSTQLVPRQGWRGWLGMREVLMTASADRPVSVNRPQSAAPEAGEPEPDPVTDGLVARLMASGVDRTLAESAVRALPESERRHPSTGAMCQALAGELAPIVASDDGYARAEVFIGPPGVGKTTTIAKIAARERASRGRKLGMLAADGFRAGAVEQLRTYANIIGSPFRVARTMEELDKALTAARQTVLVDTAGRSASDPAVRDLFTALRGRRQVRTHLVLAADTSAASARRIFDAYEDARPDRVVLTKLDEAECLSPLVGVLRDRGVPISYICGGQRIPEDLASATPALIAEAKRPVAVKRAPSGSVSAMVRRRIMWIEYSSSCSIAGFE